MSTPRSSRLQEDALWSGAGGVTEAGGGKVYFRLPARRLAVAHQLPGVTAGSSVSIVTSSLPAALPSRAWTDAHKYSRYLYFSDRGGQLLFRTRQTAPE